jgi:DnaJ-class molecular chaperone with C-terminal Zn finger domain
MPRRPKADSWQYILRFLPHSAKPVKEFAKWLEEYKPSFWVKDAQRLADCVRNRRFKKITAVDIPDTIEFVLIDDLVQHLQAINDWYNEQRWKEAERKRRLQEEYLKIPLDERQKIEYLKQIVCESPWPLENCPEEGRLFERMGRISFSKIGIVTEWLNSPAGERTSWLNETLRLAEIVRARVDIEREKKRQEEERWFNDWWRTYHSTYTSPQQNIKSAYDTLGLPVGASKLEIKSAFRRLVKKYHPDVGGNEKQFIAIQQAYEALI